MGENKKATRRWLLDRIPDPLESSEVEFIRLVKDLADETPAGDFFFFATEDVIDRPDVILRLDQLDHLLEHGVVLFYIGPSRRDVPQFDDLIRCRGEAQRFLERIVRFSVFDTLLILKKPNDFGEIVGSFNPRDEFFRFETHG
jgi:hypothetical protein